mmetsp:Transcript_114056/g.323501  ORF Transcript_114056/g.323501 Transcript_114056/m.323501 type:complete len:502 (-) Transcript_114056:7-1512(-)
MEAELSALVPQDLVDAGVGHGLHGAPGEQVLVREVRVVVHAVGLLDLRGHPILGGPRAVPAGVCLLELVRRLPNIYPVRKVSGQPFAVGDAVRLRARHPEVRRPVPLRCGPDEMIAVRWPHRGAVEHGLHAHLADLREDLHSTLQVRHEPVRLPVEEVVVVLHRHAFLAPRSRGQLHLALVGPDEDAVPLVAQVERAFQVAEDWQLVAVLLVVGLDFADGLSDEVLVLQHHGGRVHARHPAHHVAPEASGVHHEVGHGAVLLALRGPRDHLPALVRKEVEADHLRLLLDDAAESLGPVCEGVRHAGRVDMPIARRQEPAVDSSTVQLHQRMQSLDLIQADEVVLRAVKQPREDLALGDVVLGLVYVRALVRDEADRAWLVEAQRRPLLLPLRERLDPLLVPQAEIVAAVKPRHQARGVPGGTRGQLLLLEEHAADAPPGELVEQGAPGDAAPDDHADPGGGRRGGRPLLRAGAAAPRQDGAQARRHLRLHRCGERARANYS